MAKTILCVDDDSQIRELIKSFLESKGFRVVTSSDGWDCLREIVVNKPDLILMDINMPKLNGLNALDMIKVTRLLDDVPIIVVSAEDDKETVDKAHQLGADDFLVKPFSFDELGERISRRILVLDFAGLQSLMSNLKPGKPPTDTQSMVDPDRFKDWRTFFATSDKHELCVLLSKDLKLEDATRLSEPQARQKVLVLYKVRQGWKCAWPAA